MGRREWVRGELGMVLLGWAMWAMVGLVAVLVSGCGPGKGGGGASGGSASSGGVSGGGGDGVRVNFAEAAKSPAAKTKPAMKLPEYDIALGPELPSVPTTGTRKEAPAAAAEKALPIRPCQIALFPCAFDGPSQSCNSCGGSPPDPNAAAGAGKIIEVVNDLFQVTTRTGAVLCDGTLQTLLNHATDALTDPRVQFDNVNQRFSFSVTVSNPGATAKPAMFVAASETDDPCGNWNVYRMTFHGDAYPTGNFLDFPMLGQDQNALLLSLRTCKSNADCGSPIFTVFAVPKALAYTNQHVEFNSFVVDSLTAPVTNAGNPLIASPVSFFLAAVPGTGYKLYRITNSGGNGAVMTKTTINAPFKKPSRAVNQPGTKATLNSSDGSIVSFPYFDGTRIWFSHDDDDQGFPTVRYGFVDTTNNTVQSTSAYHSGTSDDFNSSLAVEITPSRETVYLNWDFTDTLAGTATTAVFAEGDANKPLVTIAGPGTPYTSGGGVATACGTSNQCRFGDFSSVTVDPGLSGCAFATQQYFGTDGNWRTRVGPIGKCENIVVK